MRKGPSRSIQEKKSLGGTEDENEIVRGHLCVVVVAAAAGQLWALVGLGRRFPLTCRVVQSGAITSSSSSR